ncbi:MAG: hypothetical protein JSW52_00105, partial [Candidatus Coatesbacteria bacterium]
AFKMPEVESIKCPNCGGAVSGAGLLLCPYCGSQLRVEGEEREEFPFAPDVARLQAEVYFDALPDVPITPATTKIPFKPNVIYDNLPGGKLEPALRKDADAIIALVETCQNAVNTEDLDSYLSTVSRDEPAFYDMAKKGAEAQFISSDMKRYTTAVDFLSLAPNAAEVAVSFEAFVFPSTKSDRPGEIIVNVTRHMEVTFNWALEKTAGRWKVVGAGLERKKVKLPVWLKVLFIVIGVVIVAGVVLGLLGALVGVAAGIIGVIVAILAAVFGSTGA